MPEEDIDPSGGLAGDEGTPPEPEGGGEPRTVPWDDHVKLRHENADYRKKWGPYEEAFDGYDDDGASNWLDFIRLARSDPETARAQMLVSLIGEEGLAALGFGEEGGQGPQEPQYITPEQLQQILGQRDQQHEEEYAIADVEDRAEQLGYEVGSLEYMQLLHLALSKHDGDLQAAHEEMGDWKQSMVDEFLKKKGSDQTPSPVSPGAGPGGDQKPPTDLKDARTAFSEYLKATP